WRLWVHKDQRGLDGLPELVVQRYNQSLLIIRSQIDHDGAITAANDTDIIGFARDTYSYMWPRDGALVAAALMRAGHVGAPEKFLQFCSHVISPLGYVRPATGLPLPSHARWEERWGVHAFTVAAVIAGLRAAARLTEAFGEPERAARYDAGAARMRDGLGAVLWNEREQRFARMASPG